MNYSTEEKELGRQDFETLRNDLHYFKPGMPQFGAYADATGRYINQSPINATIPGLAASGFKFAAQAALWTGTTFGGSIFRNAFNFAAGTLGTINWPGAVGMRWMIGAPANFMAGAASAIPGIGPVAGKIADASNAFFLGGKWSAGDAMARLSGVGRRQYGKFFTGLTQGTTEQLRFTGMWADTVTSKGVQIQGNALQKLSQLKKLNIDAKHIAAIAKSADMTTEQATSALKWTKFGVGAGAILDIVGGVSMSVQAGAFIGSVVGGAVKTGYDLTEVMGRQTKTLMNRARNIEMGGDISAYMTQAAVTERTRALQFMQNSRVNGAYMYGSETSYL